MCPGVFKFCPEKQAPHVGVALVFFFKKKQLKVKSVLRVHYIPNSIPALLLADEVDEQAAGASSSSSFF